MSKILQKCVNVLLVLAMLLTSISGICITAHAEETSVEIVSFVRGKVGDLRSSELLEAKVTGYDGKISDLTFTWDNQVRTYLYVYNSSNMYNIKDTAGEVEIDGSTYFLGILLDKGDYYSGKGYAWASVYGAQLGYSSLNGTVTVTVTDKDGNIIGKDSYTDFANASLQADLAAAKYGVFEGETINLKDMLGRSAIVHIDCEACVVGEASTANSDVISVSKDNGEYLVKGLESGIAKISLSLRKNNCKFHQNSGTCEINNEVYVFKKPITSTTTTTLTLTNIDSKCEYFIGNVAGTKTAENTVVFEDLNPDTTYEVTVRGDYGEGYAYAYVTDTTKPVFKATVNFYTDNALADTLEYYNVSGNIFLKKDDSDEYISLTKSAVGKYTAEVANGIYHIYYKNSSYTRFGDYQLTIDNENNELNIHTYSVRYDANGGTFTGIGGVHQAGKAAYVTDVLPTRSGYKFLYWTDKDGNQYKPGQVITAEIFKPYVLTAQWEDAVDVKVNVTLNHGQDNSSDDDVAFRLIKIVNGVSYPTEYAEELTADSHAGYAYSSSGTVSTYTAATKTFDGEKGAKYSVTCGKSGYELKSVSSTTDAEGNTVIDVELEFAPNNFDLVFNVKMDESVPSQLYPASVNVQVTYWGYDSNDKLGWHIIEQHKDGTSVPVGFDANGNGTGSYPVWQLWSDNINPYFYRIEVDSYILADGTIVTNTANAFVSEVEVVGGGGTPKYPDGSNTEYVGAFYENNVQNGIPTATISIKSYDLTFNANGGKISGLDKLTLNNQVIIPDLLNYVPTRDGGYTFTGWYKDSNCTEKVESGKRIYADTTLYAGWEAPLSVSGTIEVEGFYYQDNEKVQVLDVDRAQNIVTTLQVKYGNTYNDIMSVISELEYGSDGIARVHYEFPYIPDTLASGTEYRIRTALINYETLYNNNGDNNFTSAEYTASFKSGKTAVVDALLKFKADEFVQNYEIDATLIGEGYRPQSGITQVLFQTNGTTPPNTVISQHTASPYGESFAFENNGIAKGSLSLWKGISSGAMSTYQLKLKELDGTAYDSTSPYSVRYGATTNWNASNATAGTLKATLVPKEYIVNLDINTTDEVTGMSDYLNADGSGYFTTHKWSHDTLIDAKPEREGYVFLGWEAVEEDTFNEATQIVAGSVAKDITIKAKWAQFKWVTDTDSGYINVENGKESVIRFLFDVATTEELRNKITQTGIKFIKSSDIGNKVEDSNVAGEALTGSSTTFYGDITNIPQTKAGIKYYALGFVVCDGEINWSLPVECEADFNDLILYE